MLFKFLNLCYFPDDPPAGGDPGAASPAGPPGGGEPGAQINPPEVKFLVGEDGKFSDGWLDNVPDEYPVPEVAKTMPDIYAMLKTLDAGQRKLGVNPDLLIQKPQEHWGDEDYNNFYDSIGAPKEAEAFKEIMAKPESLPEGLEWDEGFADGFGKLAAELRMMPSQVKAVAEWYNGLQAEQQTARIDQAKQSDAAAEEELRREFGDNYDVNLEAAQNVVRKFADQKDIELLEKDGLGNDPRLVRLLAKVGQSMRETKILADNEVGQLTGLVDELNSIMANPAYMDGKDPRHAAMVARALEIRTKLSQKK